MGMIVAQETHEVTVQRIERNEGETEFEYRTPDGAFFMRYPSSYLPQPERQPLPELAWKGRFNAMKEL